MKKNLLVVSFIFFTSLAFGQTADFSFTSTELSFCTPSSVRFTQQCSGNPIALIWDFGNNTTSADLNPTINFTTAGSYNVKLTAIYDQTSVEIIKVVTINPAADISIRVDRNYICKPGVINFTAINNGNIASFEWDFGDGSNKVITTSPTASHIYAAMGTYPATLKATNVSGCSDSSSAVIEVKPLVINATVSLTEGCIPAVSNFRATPVVPANSTITGYNWNFGDATAQVSTTSGNINHTFSITGRFTPVLTVNNSEGCSNTFTFPEVGFGTPPARPVAYTRQPVFCASENPQMIANSANATTYLWDFGDIPPYMAFDTIERHKYNSLGIKPITVTPFFNGCEGLPASFTVRVVGVIADYKYANTCSDKKTYTFNNISSGNITSYLWEFGDDGQNQTTRNTTHLFPEVGTFYAKLTIEDNVSGCVDSLRKIIYTANPVLRNPDTTLCKNSTTTFTIDDNYRNPSVSMNWTIAGQTINASAINPYVIKADSLGYFTNSVIIKNGAESCPDTLSLSNVMLVKGPLLDFNADQAICFNTAYQVTNNSTPFRPEDAINQWEWNFGESTDNQAVYQPSAYSYKRGGLFRVKLMASDNNGCTDTLVKTVRVNAMPILRAMPRVDTLCSGQPDTIVAFHNGKLEWMPANVVSCDSCDSVIVNPTNTTWLRLKATSTANCVSTDSVLVRVFNPFSAGANPEDAYICLKESTVLNVLPADKKISWFPTTNLSSSTSYLPVAKPTATTVYTATLSDSAGCFKDSVKVKVHVKSLPTVNAGADQFVSFSSSYTIAPMYSNNVRSYLWTLDNGLNCNNCATPNGVADNSKTHKITVMSDSGCTASDIVNIYIQCSDSYLLMPGAFSPNNDGNNDTYFPLTRGIKTIKHFAIYNRQGQLVFQAQNFIPNAQGSGWNGYFKGNPQMPGTYIYVMDALCDAGETLSKKGSFVLIR